MTTCCPDCYCPTNSKPNAKEGRCDRCRPARQHSVKREPNAKARWQALLAEHGGQRWQPS